MPTPDDALPIDPTPDPNDTLSPAARRLVRQFDLDITGIHGTGPEGRIRVSDVIGLLGGRTDSGVRDAARHVPLLDPDDTLATDDDGTEAEEPPLAAHATPAATPIAAAVAPTSSPTTTVFDCDLSRVLSHRKKRGRDDAEPLFVSYVLVALAEALEAVPELATAWPASVGLVSVSANQEPRSASLEVSSAAGATLDERLRAIDAALRAGATATLTGADLLVHNYGESGSLLATPTPLGPGHAASLGIGRVRREIVVRTVDGMETPRVAARCYLSASFLADRVAFHRANRFLAHAVRVLEQWPEPTPTTSA